MPAIDLASLNAQRFVKLLAKPENWKIVRLTEETNQFPSYQLVIGPDCFAVLYGLRGSMYSCPESNA